MHPEILSITLFGIVAAFTPGPNNFVAFYSGFNFGIVRTLPHIIGVTLGFPFLLLCLALGLINIFKLYPLIQEILKYLGTLFLIYLAYKISFSGPSNQENKNKNPIKFHETFIFQFLAFEIQTKHAEAWRQPSWKREHERKHVYIYIYICIYLFMF